MKIAIYCRVSSDDQKERETIENQVETLETYADMKEGMEIVGKYLDDGISGTIAFQDRPEGKRLINDAKCGMFEAILVYKVDRFGRDTLSGLSAVELLRSLNVEIISLTEPFDLNTPTGRFQFINYLNMAELERNNILDRMFLGATRAAKQGKWMGGIVPYGYYVNKDKYLEINQGEADIVRYIYYMYTVEHVNTVDIAIYLNTNGIPCNYLKRGTGKREKSLPIWSTSSVQRILSSTTYMGIHEYGKRSTKRKETIVREVPAIVPIEVWNQARELRKANKIMSARNSPNKNFLLRTLIKCGECGHTYYGVYYKDGKSVYTCVGKKKHVREIYNIKCNNVNVPADALEDYVWNMCKEVLSNCEKYEIKSDNTEDIKNINFDIQGFNDKIHGLETEKANVLKLYRKGIIEEADVEVQFADLKKDEESYKKLIAESKEKIKILEDKESIKSGIKSKIEMYNERINNISDDDKMKIIRLLVKEIVVTTTIQNGSKVPSIHLKWNLSDLLFEPSRLQMLSQKFIKKFPTYYIGDENYQNSNGYKLSKLRIDAGITKKKFSKLINISEITLRKVEDNVITRQTTRFYKMYCNYFHIDYKKYLDIKKEG